MPLGEGVIGLYRLLPDTQLIRQGGSVLPIDTGLRADPGHGTEHIYLPIFRASPLRISEAEFSVIFVHESKHVLDVRNGETDYIESFGKTYPEARIQLEYAAVRWENKRAAELNLPHRVRYTRYGNDPFLAPLDGSVQLFDGQRNRISPQRAYDIALSNRLLTVFFTLVERSGARVPAELKSPYRILSFDTLKQFYVRVEGDPPPANPSKEYLATLDRLQGVGLQIQVLVRRMGVRESAEQLDVPANSQSLPSYRGLELSADSYFYDYRNEEGFTRLPGGLVELPAAAPSIGFDFEDIAVEHNGEAYSFKLPKDGLNYESGHTDDVVTYDTVRKGIKLIVDLRDFITEVGADTAGALEAIQRMLGILNSLDDTAAGADLLDDINERERFSRDDIGAPVDDAETTFINDLQLRELSLERLFGDGAISAAYRILPKHVKGGVTVAYSTGRPGVEFPVAYVSPLSRDDGGEDVAFIAHESQHIDQHLSGFAGNNRSSLGIEIALIEGENDAARASDR